MTTPPIFTVAQAALLLGKSKRRVLQLITERGLVVTRFGNQIQLNEADLGALRLGSGKALGRPKKEGTTI